MTAETTFHQLPVRNRLQVLPSKDDLLVAFQNQSVQSVPTPAFVIDRAIFARNCARMHEAVKGLGAQFRAHVKSHKVCLLGKTVKTSNHHFLPCPDRPWKALDYSLSRNVELADLSL
jgi:hypothetical protein